MINYDKRNLEFNFSVDVLPVKVSLGDFKTGTQKIREASAFAQSLDQYLYQMCKICQILGKDDPEWRKYIKIRIGALNILQGLQITLIAFESDPDGQKDNLDNSVKSMQHYLELISKEALPNIRSELQGIESELHLSKKDIQPVKQEIVSEALNIASLSEEEAEEEANNIVKESEKKYDSSNFKKAHSTFGKKYKRKLPAQISFSSIRRLPRVIVNQPRLIKNIIKQPYNQIKEDNNITIEAKPIETPPLSPMLSGLIKSILMVIRPIPIESPPYFLWETQYHVAQYFGRKGRIRSAGSGDGQFDQPTGVAVDYSSGIYVVEPSNNRIALFILNDSEEQIKKGNYFFTLKEYNKAIECFDKAIQIDAKHAYAWTNKGIVFYQLKEYNKAIECFDKAIQIDAKIEFTYLNKASCLLQTKKYDDAIENFRRVLEVNPKNVDALMNMGLIHYIFSNYDDAILCFNKILRIIPYSAQSFSLRGSCKIKTGNIESGIKDLVSAINIDKEGTIELLKGDEIFENIKEHEPIKSLISSINHIQARSTVRRSPI